MRFRINILIFPLLCVSTLKSAAQNDDRYLRADSITWDLYQKGDWKALLKAGKESISNHADFPNLRVRMAYAAFLSENFSEALVQYHHVLNQDSYNQTARYFASLCEEYLNRDQLANYHRSFLFKTEDQQMIPAKISVAGVSIESSFKKPDYSLRGMGYFNRFGINLRLSSRLQLDQSASWFRQQLFAEVTSGTSNVLIKSPNQQGEYFAKINYLPAQNFILWAGYHYLGSTLDNVSYYNHITLLGMRYSAPYFSLQADVNLGIMVDRHLRQYNASLSYFPWGNLSLYGTTRVSLKDSSEMVLSQLLGFRFNSKTWIEGSASIGPLDNFIEADGLYVYNSIDPSRRKSGGSVLYLLQPKTILSLNYTNERKELSNQLIQYHRHSITAGISWKL